MVSLSDVCMYHDHMFSSFRELPKALKSRTYELNGDTLNRYDLVSPFKLGKEWAYQFMLETQPKTAKQLLNGSDFRLVVGRGVMGDNIKLVQEVNGQVVNVQRRTLGYNPDDSDYPATIERINSNLSKKWGHPRRIVERHLSLPEPIRMAYYNRIDGLQIPEGPTFGAYGRILPFSASGEWDSIDGYLGNLRLKKKLLPIIEEMIPGIKPNQKDMPYINFMMFLSSWGSFIGKKRSDGDHLFVKNHIQDGVIYYIRDADVENMMILADPADAIDQYCEHVLLRKEERFDFRPWAIQFEPPSVLTS